MFIPFTSLNVGYINAENYQKRENKELFNKYFVRDHYLDQLLDPNVFFLIGEKGTGKTSYATYLGNNEFKKHKTTIFNVRQSEYQKFVEMKRLGHLTLSQYSAVWSTLLLMMATTSILEKSGTPEFLQRFTKLAALKSALKIFYKDAFAPEIVQLFTCVESDEFATTLEAKLEGIGSKLAGKSKSERTDSKTVFQTNLMTIRRAFEAALTGLKLDDHALIFIDGVDARPSDIPYDDYFQCIRGLIDAVWAINNDFLANIKDSRGRIRIILLIRPDIFLRAGLHNLNTKLRDNSVYLDWSTTYKDYRGSLLFRVADRLLSTQQPEPDLKDGEAWDHYFPFFAENVRAAPQGGEEVNSFLAFLRFGYYRPRDINAMIGTMQSKLRKSKNFAEYVTAEDFRDPSFRDAHAEYLLGEIRDQLLFYYSQDEYTLFLQFFSHLRGRQKFTYEQYLVAFNEFIEECSKAKKLLPQFFENADVFLQFIYEQNVICYKEYDATETRGEPFIRWCFRERTLSTISPKVRIGVEYEIFYGLTKALNVGRVIKVAKAHGSPSVGTIIKIDREKGFGFLRGGAQHSEYYFKLSEFVGDKHLLRETQKVSFSAVVKYGKPRAEQVKPQR